MDSLSLVLITVLLLSNIAQFWFWSRQNERLVDKLMSRNYAEYVQSHTSAQVPLTVQKSIDPEDLKIEDADVLRELNRALPI